jgi:hypothetical protein
MACERLPNPELVGDLMEANPVALFFVGLTGAFPNSFPGAIAELVAGEARTAFLALAETVLHEATRGVVPDPIRQVFWTAVSERLHHNRLNGSALGMVRAILQQVQGGAFWQLRSDILNNDAVQTLLGRNEVFRELVCGFYRMNQAGRLLEDAPSPAHILAATGGNLSCIYLHVRDNPHLVPNDRWHSTTNDGFGGIDFSMEDLALIDTMVAQATQNDGDDSGNHGDSTIDARDRDAATSASQVTHQVASTADPFGDIAGQE